MLLALMLVSPNRASAQATLAEADMLIHETNAIRGRDYATVDQKLRRALAIKEAFLGTESPHVSDIRGMLGRNAWNRRDLDAAEHWFTSQLATEERIRPESFQASRAMGDLGATLRDKCRLAEAEQFVTRSLALRRRLFGLSHGWVGSSLDNMSRINEMQDRLAEAEARTEEAVAISTPNDPNRNERVARLQCLREMQAPGSTRPYCWPSRCAVPIS